MKADGGYIRGKISGKRESVHHDGNDILIFPDRLCKLLPYPVLITAAPVQCMRGKNEILTGLDLGQELLIELAGTQYFRIIKNNIAPVFQSLINMHGGHVAAIAPIRNENIRFLIIALPPYSSLNRSAFSRRRVSFPADGKNLSSRDRAPVGRHGRNRSEQNRLICKDRDQDELSRTLRAISPNISQA